VVVWVYDWQIGLQDRLGFFAANESLYVAVFRVGHFKTPEVTTGAF
jgi:hypothetical protein